MRNFLQNQKTIIGMIHVEALPGTPRFGGRMAEVIAKAREEALLYKEAGIAAVNLKFLPGVWVLGLGDDARIEARGSKNEARAPRFSSRVSIRDATTKNSIFNLTIQASLPLPLDKTYFLLRGHCCGDIR